MGIRRLPSVSHAREKRKEHSPDAQTVADDTFYSQLLLLLRSIIDLRTDEEYAEVTVC